MGKYVEYVVPTSGTMGDEQLKAAPLHAAGVDPKARRRKYWVAGGVLALALAGIVLAITLPLTLDKDSKNSSSKSVTVIGDGSSGSSGRDTSPIVPASRINVTGRVREYFIAAEYHGWVYSPLNMNNCTGDAYASKVTEALAPADAYRKAVFRQYTDASFEVRVLRPEDEEHLGYLGPVLRAEEGDFLRITLFNALDYAINIAPSGLLFDPPAVTEPATKVEYVWSVPAPSTPPGPHDPTSRMWVYSSTVDPVLHTNAGLLGPLVVTRKGRATADARPTGVDREVFMFLHVVNEELLPSEMLVDLNEGDLGEGDAPPAPATDRRRLRAAVNATTDAANATVDTTNRNLKHSINGYIYCNVPSISARLGDKVRWYVAGMGNEVDLHTAHWHGITLSKAGHRVDQVQLLPGVTHTLDSEADNPGTWLFHCHVNSHLVNGMMALFHISGPLIAAPAAPAKGGQLRKHYISADLVEWDYAPSNGDLCGGSGAPANFTEDQLVFMGSEEDRIGKKYLKARYVEYTDATFTKKVVRGARDVHLGLQGPLLRAEVGDVIDILFRNALPSLHLSMHPHGVLYAKSSEGAPYNDGTSGPLRLDDHVPPNGTHRYVWGVPDRAGPGPLDPSSLLWMYHSHTDERKDTYTGLFGGVLVTRKGAARGDGSPRDVDREMVFMFSVLDETSSGLLGENGRRYLGLGGAVDAYLLGEHTGGMEGPHIVGNPLLDAVVGGLYKPAGGGEVAQEDIDGFVESNLMHSINGFMFCNLPGTEVGVGERVRMYFMTIGDTYDMHAPVMFTGKFEEGGRAEQGLQLLPGAMMATDLQPAAVGAWVLHCQVDDHVLAGMRAIVNVTAVNGSSEGVDGVPAGARVRKYYVSAEEVMWDYAPLGQDGCTNKTWNPEQYSFTEMYVGSEYKKARFVEYVDAGWGKKVQDGVHGYLGPFIQAEVGDVVEVVFRNMLNFSSSLRFQGGLVPVDKTGKLTPQEVAEGLQVGVPPGGKSTTYWVVPETAGPAANASVGVVGYTYVSGVDEIVHTHAGLVGVAAVGRKGVFGAGGAGVPKGMDFMVPMLFTIVNENQSPYYEWNMVAANMVGGDLQEGGGGRRLLGGGRGAERELLEGDGSDPVEESNLMHAVNGRVYCNLEALKLVQGRQGVVVLAAVGSEFDMHSPVFEGQEVRESGAVVQAANLLPASTRVAVVTGGVPGRWRGYCAVQDHIQAGMVFGMEVAGEGQPAGRKLAGSW